MQITLNIDDDVFETAKSVAERQSRPVASVISEMARRGMESEHRLVLRNGFPVLVAPENGDVVTLEQIRQIQDEMDEEEVREANDFSAGRQPPDRAGR
ncbi:hypothetical protein C8J32_102835 [Rhizobium sp. PP-CC-3A-592]|nr:hypothetical protein C8J32_102835 [Rhizobium sp. PP-CC-3A-592]